MAAGGKQRAIAAWASSNKVSSRSIVLLMTCVLASELSSVVDVAKIMSEAADGPSRADVLASMPEDAAKLQEANEMLIANAKRDGKEGNLMMGKDGKVVLLDESSLGGDCGKYSWGQDEDECFVRVKVPAGTKSKAVKMDVSSSKFKLTVLGDVILDGDLFKRCKPDDCTFTLEDAKDSDGRVVVVQLSKLQRTSAQGHWKCICLGEPEIDLSKFGPAVMTADPNDPNAIAQMLRESGLGS